jgi:hypothetical protein
MKKYICIIASLFVAAGDLYPMNVKIILDLSTQAGLRQDRSAQIRVPDISELNPRQILLMYADITEVKDPSSYNLPRIREEYPTLIKTRPLGPRAIELSFDYQGIKRILMLNTEKIRRKFDTCGAIPLIFPFEVIIPLSREGEYKLTFNKFYGCTPIADTQNSDDIVFHLYQNGDSGRIVITDKKELADEEDQFQKIR